MLKRLITPIQKWLRPEDTAQDQQIGQDNEVSATRRSFFKRAAVGAVSIAGTAGVAKTVVDSMPLPDLKDKYEKDALAGERELQDREYVLMSDEEKADMLKSFTDSYSDQS